MTFVIFSSHTTVKESRGIIRGCSCSFQQMIATNLATISKYIRQQSPLWLDSHNYYLSLVSSPAFSETQEPRNSEHPHPDPFSAPLKPEQLFAARALCPLASFRM